MNRIDIVLIVLIALALLLAVRSLYKAKKSGKSCSCGGDCSRCAQKGHHNRK
jgi:hypothetical protein